MKTPKFFRLEEFLTSSTARQRSIENLPSWEIIENLCELGCFLDDLRVAWGGHITITSGYRNKALNRAVGGVDTSVHQKGLACDMVPGNGDFEGFVRFIKNWLKDKDFDQVLIEQSKKSRWVHFGLRSNSNTQRHIISNMTVK